MNLEHVMTTTYSRRRLLAMGGSVAAVGLAARLLPAAAHGPDATMGYGELAVTVEEKAIKVPAQVPSGLTYINLKNASKNDGLVVAWGRLADGVTKEEVAAAVVPSADGQIDAAIELLKAKKLALLGGPSGPTPGRTTSGVVRLAEGPHAFFDVFTGTSAFFDVTPAAAGAKAEEPKADVTVKLGNMVFVGLDQGVPTGKHLWQVENIDTMEHELIIAPLEPGQTADDVKKLLEQDEAGGDQQGGDQQSGDQAAGSGGDQNANQPNGGASIMSSGEKVWQMIDLPAGHYAAFCMVPMDWSGPPHALMGMIKVFDAK